MIDARTPLPNVDRFHALEERLDPSGVDVVVVVCPFTDVNGLHHETPWSARDTEPADVTCTFCLMLAELEEA